jgi:hypothetical protein
MGSGLRALNSLNSQHRLYSGEGEDSFPSRLTFTMMTPRDNEEVLSRKKRVTQNAIPLLSDLES